MSISPRYRSKYKPTESEEDLEEKKLCLPPVGDVRSRSMLRQTSSSESSTTSVTSLPCLDKNHHSSTIEDTSPQTKSSDLLLHENEKDIECLKSLTEAFQKILPAIEEQSIRNDIALANRIKLSEVGGFGSEYETMSEECSESKLPSLRLVSFLSSWASDMLSLVHEARECFKEFHYGNGDKTWQLLTPPHIYKEWQVKSPHVGRGMDIVHWYKHLSEVKNAEMESATYVDAFAVALGVSPHELKSDVAFAKEVRARWKREDGESKQGVEEGDREREASRRKWASSFLHLLKEVKECSDFYQLSHRRKAHSDASLTPPKVFREWTVDVPGPSGKVEKSLLEWYWDLKHTREQEADAERYADAFAAAVGIPAQTLKDDLAMAYSVLYRNEEGGDSGNKSDSQSESKGQQSHVRSKRRTWAALYVQMMREVKSCFVFHQLSHGHDRMKGSTPSHVFQDWTVEVELDLNDNEDGTKHRMTIGLLQWFCNMYFRHKTAKDSCDDAALQSLTAALHALLPSIEEQSIRNDIALANRIKLSEVGGFGSEYETMSEECSESKLPSLRLVSFLSSWASDMLSLVHEARECFKEFHYGNGDKTWQLPTPPHIYKEWQVKSPHVGKGMDIVHWYKHLSEVKNAEMESATYVDAFAVALGVSPHELKSDVAFAKEVRARWKREDGESKHGVEEGDREREASRRKWASSFLHLLKEVKECSDFYQLSHRRKAHSDASLTPPKVFREWTVDVPGPSGKVEKSLLEWYWDLKHTREQEADAERYADAFAAAVGIPAQTLKDDLAMAYSVLYRNEEGGDSGNKSDSQSESKGQQSHVRSKRRTWAALYVQMMREVKSCFVFHQLSHGHDRMKGSTPSHVFQDWTVEVELDLNDNEDGTKHRMTIGLLQLFWDVSALGEV